MINSYVNVATCVGIYNVGWAKCGSGTLWVPELTTSARPHRMGEGAWLIVFWSDNGF